MHSFNLSKTNLFKPLVIALCAFCASPLFAPEARAAKVAVKKSALPGIIKGIVRDDAGNPIADATIAIFRVGTSKLLKQVSSGVDGSFLAKVLPGTYTILAVAEGFNPVTLSTVEVNRSAELVYGFKLERAGGGNTLPEKRADRNNPKWRIRAANSRRSIYQNQEGSAPIDENKTNDAAAENSLEQNTEIGEADETDRAGQTVVETYFAGSDAGNYTGLNFARRESLSENAEIVFAGQTGTSGFAPQRFEANVKYRPNETHQIRLNTSIAKLGEIRVSNREDSLGQISVQALDEWKFRGGVILVLGFDYTRFLGAGSDAAVSPRLGVQFDVNSKTRFRSSYTMPTQEQGWQRAIELEDAQILFREPVVVENFAVENNKPRLNRSSRLEFGIERVLDNRSNVEANVFFDATSGRGVGLMQLPFAPLSGENFGRFVADQQGRARGVRVVYSRRLNGTFTTSAGYAFGSGQKLSPQAVSNPAKAFENDWFQSFVGQLSADLKTGTRVKTIFRLSPQATVFAIDPFAGKLAVYDPSLSVLVTQTLPNLGPPFRAEAIVDARNLFDFQSNISTEEGSLRLNSQRRTVRGGIMVRF